VRVEALELRAVELPRRERFTIATGSSDTVKAVVVKLTVEGVVGYGAGSGNSVTGETSESIRGALETLRANLAGKQLQSTQALREAMERAVPNAPAARAGVDIAFHDALAKAVGKSVCRVLGGSDEPVLTDMTIGISSTDDAVDKAKGLALACKALKLKVGTDLEGDIARVRAVREAVGPGTRLWCDANQGYEESEAARFLEAVAELGVEFVEQPVKADDADALARLARAAPVPVMADEAAKGPTEYGRLLDLGVRHFNIKLMKCGGIRPACKLVDLLKEHGAFALVGCMGESGVSLAGALHFASANSHVVKWADLDSQFMLARDVCAPLDFSEGMLTPRGPGTGIKMREPF
jgi:L-alanine-DL-glutamate epimerase-like enolase superfamily enzyme